MGKYSAAACLPAVLLLFGVVGCVAQPRAGGRARPAARQEGLPPSRLLVELWPQKVGIFNEAKMATLLGRRLYVSGWPRGVEAINVESGLTDWIYPSRLPIDAAPTESEKTAYLVDGGQIVTVDLSNGIEQSRTRTRFGILTPIYLGVSECVFGSGDEHVYGVSPTTGLKEWRVSLDGYVAGSAWPGGDLAYFVSSQGTVHAIFISTHETAWRHTFDKPWCSAPSLAGEVLYIGSVDYYLYALDARSGSVLWRVVLGAPVLGAVVAAGPRVYATTTEEIIHAVDTTAQRVVWTVPGHRVLTTTPEHVIFTRRQGGDNVICVADSTTGKVLSEAAARGYELFAAAPEGGIFYAVSRTGGVLALGDRAVIEARRAQEEKEKK